MPNGNEFWNAWSCPCFLYLNAINASSYSIQVQLYKIKHWFWKRTKGVISKADEHLRNTLMFMQQVLFLHNTPFCLLRKSTYSILYNCTYMLAAHGPIDIFSTSPWNIKKYNGCVACEFSPVLNLQLWLWSETAMVQCAGFLLPAWMQNCCRLADRSCRCEWNVRSCRLLPCSSDKPADCKPCRSTTAATVPPERV